MRAEHRLRVGLMPYLNSEPFYYAFDSTGMELHPMVPSAMAQAADAGSLDAGPIPIVDCFRLEDRFVPVDGFCIATGQRARSILFFSDRPVQALDDAAVAVTNESSTSAQLLRVLLACKYGVQPRRYVSLDEPHNAYLLIGDNALRGKGDDATFSYRYDLGKEWHHWTGLPFVFARWIARREVPADLQRQLRDRLDASIKAALRNVEDIAEKRHAGLGLTPQEVVEYVRSFRYVIGPEEEQAIERFRGLLEALPTS